LKEKAAQVAGWPFRFRAVFGSSVLGSQFSVQANLTTETQRLRRRSKRHFSVALWLRGEDPLALRGNER